MVNLYELIKERTILYQVHVVCSFKYADKGGKLIMTVLHIISSIFALAGIGCIVMCDYRRDSNVVSTRTMNKKQKFWDRIATACLIICIVLLALSYILF